MLVIASSFLLENAMSFDIPWDYYDPDYYTSYSNEPEDDDYEEGEPDYQAIYEEHQDAIAERQAQADLDRYLDWLNG